MEYSIPAITPKIIANLERSAISSRMGRCLERTITVHLKRAPGVSFLMELWRRIFHRLGGR